MFRDLYYSLFRHAPMKSSLSLSNVFKVKRQNDFHHTYIDLDYRVGVPV